MRVVPLEPSRRLSGDNGSALVEAAFITPVLMYLLFAIFEMGLYFRNYLTLGVATQDASRTASILGNQVDTDYIVIQAVKKSTAGIQRATITKLVIFNASANGANSVVPAACSAPGNIGTPVPASGCNVYTVALDWNANTNANYITCTSGARSSGWCPVNRKTALTGTNSPPDYAGIYIEFTHRYMTGLFGTTKRMTDQTITRLEPQSLA